MNSDVSSDAGAGVPAHGAQQHRLQLLSAAAPLPAGPAAALQLSLQGEMDGPRGSRFSDLNSCDQESAPGE